MHDRDGHREVWSPTGWAPTGVFQGFGGSAVCATGMGDASSVAHTGLLQGCFTALVGARLAREAVARLFAGRPAPTTARIVRPQGGLLQKRHRLLPTQGSTEAHTCFSVGAGLAREAVARLFAGRPAPTTAPIVRPHRAPTNAGSLVAHGVGSYKKASARCQHGQCRGWVAQQVSGGCLVHPHLCDGHCLAACRTRSTRTKSPAKS